ncbi:neuroblastoma breakpoint family member 3-like, partial [Hylobates moloch]|uniref:neuroblastoma breakpoint family member 3-like n=1 Tax=Hylobates moloch TaxID=81572 RepID=UPI0026744B3C
RKDAFGFRDHSILSPTRSSGRFCCLISVGCIFCHPCPAWLIRNLQESEEEEAPQESWDEGDSTLSIPPDMSASYQSDRSTFHSVEEQQVGLALDIGRHWCDQVKKEDQEATGPWLSRELPDEKESEVLQDSLDRFYSTPSGYLELPDLCQPYRSAFYSWEEQHLGLALDVDSEYLTMKVIRLHLVLQIGVIFLFQVALTDPRDVIAAGRTYGRI